MRGEIKPGGHLKNITIFFSDIRGFTEKSENFANAFGDKAPGHIVTWLNDYFTHMIQCVGKTGGQVDKFIGDGVMAHWGTLDTAGDEALNAYNCIKAALIMRESLVAINSKRDIDDPTNPPIRIGCGINSGMVTAGQIGSEQRMEYTVIGDSVNVASRIESLNKIFGTDILISENTWKLTRDKFIIEEMPRASLKGKEKPVRVFAVVNTKDSSDSLESAGPQTLAEVRTLLGIQTPYLNMATIYHAGDFDSAILGGRGSKISSGRNFSLTEKRYNKYRRQILDRRFLLKNFKAETDAATGPTIIMTSFGSFARVNGQAGKPVPVTFSWDISDYTPDTHVIIEVAEDAYFTRMVEKRDLGKTIGEPRPSSHITINLKENMYWWRVYPSNGNSRTEGSQIPATLLYPFGILLVEKNAEKK
jgi:class 3 adenylate cyclase